MLRPYQRELKTAIYGKWEQGLRNIVAVMPTGAGKTVTMASVACDRDEPNIAIAHRQELVAQISMAFARSGLTHRIIAPTPTIKAITAMHVDALGKSFVRANAHVAVAGVDTILKRPDDDFLKSVRLWQCDECHHLRIENKWGITVNRFTEAQGVGWTATPIRTDRKSLKRGHGGVFDAMVVGPSMRDLINLSYLVDYRIYGLPQVIDVRNVKVNSGGEFSQSSLSQEAHASRITGDIVEHYSRLAAGKSGVTFAVDVSLAMEHAEAFRAEGVTAGVLSAKTPLAQRIEMIRAFRNRELMQIVNVDVLGEGFDMPGIEVVSMARPTMSLGLFVQQFGRGLRIKEGKSLGLILDHVGNVARHGLPDAPRAWRLDLGKRAQSGATVKINVCGNSKCAQVYEGYEPCCPYCGWEPDKSRAERERPETVAGDLTLYTPELLATLRREAARIAGPVQYAANMSGAAAWALERRWEDRREAQQRLVTVIDEWAGYWVNEAGDSVRAAYRRFFATFGVDTLGALSQTGPEMQDLIERVQNDRN